MIPSWRLGLQRLASPRRLREEGAVGVAIMISDTRGLWHADMIRSAAARPRGAKSATGVLGLVLTRWRLASTDAGRNEALGLHELERRRFQAGTLSGFVEHLCMATAAGVECRVVPASRVTSHSNDLNANNSKKSKNGQQPQPGFKNSSPVKVKNPQVGVLPVGLLGCWAVGLLGGWAVGRVRVHWSQVSVAFEGQTRMMVFFEHHPRVGDFTSTSFYSDARRYMDHIDGDKGAGFSSKYHNGP